MSFSSNHLLCLTLVALWICLQSAQKFPRNVCDDENEVCFSYPEDISVIDVSPLLSVSNDAEKKHVRALIDKACRTWGMFYVINHGTVKISKDFNLAMRNFFQSTADVKNSVRRQQNNSRGFADDELTKQKVDMKEIFDVGHKPFGSLPDDAMENRMLDGYNQWPLGPGLENFRTSVETYYAACSDLAAVLLSAISINLGVDHAIFGNAFNNHTSFLRLNYYPVVSRPNTSEDFLGISRHTDAGMLTLLFQDSNSALEVYSGSKEDNNDGEWFPVRPLEGSLAVNVCDMLQVISSSSFHSSPFSSSSSSRSSL